MTLQGTHKVECVGYDGRGRRTVTESAPYPFGLAFHDGVLYWTDWERLTSHYITLHCSFSCEVTDQTVNCYQYIPRYYY